MARCILELWILSAKSCVIILVYHTICSSLNVNHQSEWPSYSLLLHGYIAYTTYKYTEYILLSHININLQVNMRPRRSNRLSAIPYARRETHRSSQKTTRISDPQSFQIPHVSAVSQPDAPASQSHLQSSVDIAPTQVHADQLPSPSAVCPPVQQAPSGTDQSYNK